MLNTARYIWNHPLASRNRREAFARYFRWQIGSRIVGSPVNVPFIGETVLVAERGMTGASGNIYCGLHEFADMAFLLHFLRSKDLFVDIGANVGSYSILAAGVVGASVVALEPLPFTFGRMARNIRYNGLTDLISAHCCAAGADEGEILFSADRDTMNRAVNSDYTGSTVTVPMVTLDKLLERHHATMWKVDVEGFEPAVIAGARQALTDSSLHAVLLEGNQDEVVHAMLNARFVRAGYDPFRRSVTLTSEAESTGENTLWIRDRSMELVQERCRSAPSFTALSLRI